MLSLLQLKDMSHENVQQFIGACTEAGHECYVVQYQARGTLQVRAHTTHFNTAMYITWRLNSLTVTVSKKTFSFSNVNY